MMTEEIRLKAAKTFILEKDFSTARAILQSISGNSVAQDWLSKLNTISAPLEQQALELLIPNITRDEIFAELMRRAVMASANSSYGVSWDKWREPLAQVLQSKPNMEMLSKIQAIISMFRHWQEDDPIVQRLVYWLKTWEDRSSPTLSLIHDILVSIDTIYARRSLLAHPLGSSSEFVATEVVETKKRDDALKVYTAFRNGEEILRIDIVEAGKHYDIRHPDYHTLANRIRIDRDVVSLLYDIADSEIESLYILRDWREAEASAWHTYTHDIAPYENDD